MRSVVLRFIELKLGGVVGKGPLMFVVNFSRWPEIKHPEVKLLYLWLPNLVRTPDRNVMHSWGQRSCRGQLWGQPRVKLLRNAIWPSNLVGRTLDWVERTLDRRVSALMGSKVMKGQPGVKLIRNALRPPNLVGRKLDQSATLAGVKVHAEVSWGQIAWECSMASKFCMNLVVPETISGRVVSSPGLW